MRVDCDVKYGTGTTEIDNPLFVASNGKQMFLLVRAARISKAQTHREIRLPEVGEEFVRQD